MLGFHAVGSRAVCAGRGIFLRSTGTLVSSSMGSVSVTAKGWRLTSVAAAVGPAGIEQSTSTRRGTEVASAASLGFVSGLVLSTRHTSAAAGTASGVEAFGIGIRVTILDLPHHPKYPLHAPPARDQPGYVSQGVGSFGLHAAQRQHHRPRAPNRRLFQRPRKAEMNFLELVQRTYSEERLSGVGPQSVTTRPA
jgi:hypothetical protein